MLLGVAEVAPDKKTLPITRYNSSQQGPGIVLPQKQICSFEEDQKTGKNDFVKVSLQLQFAFRRLCQVYTNVSGFGLQQQKIAEHPYAGRWKSFKPLFAIDLAAWHAVE